MIIAAAGTMVALVTTPAAAAPGADHSAGGIARGGLLDGSPGQLIADPRTDTVYVPIQCERAFCDGPPDDVVDVIDGRRCNIHHDDCRVIGRIRVGDSPLHAVIDPRTDTMYVANAGAIEPGTDAGSVSVVDIAHCNARTTSGCSAAVATIPTGGFLIAAALDRVRDTLYVADLNGRVMAVNTQSCNADTQAGCGAPVRSIDVAAGADGIDLDSVSGTVYAVSAGDDGTDNILSVIDAVHCNGTDGSGCGNPPTVVHVGSGAFWVIVNRRSRTVFTANVGDDSVSVLDAATCNARHPAGCPAQATSVDTGSGGYGIAVDPRRHTLFAANSTDDTLSAIDTRTCTGATVAGCPATAPARHAGEDQGALYVNFPSFFTLLPDQSTIYLVNVGGTKTFNVLTTDACNAKTSRGCRVEAPAVPEPAGEIALDPGTDTVYLSNTAQPQLDVIAGRHCNAADRTQCTPVASIPVADPFLTLSTIDPRTDTLYAVDQGTGEVQVIDLRACNARRVTGCATAVRGTMQVGTFAVSAALNPRTQTLYVVYGQFDGSPHHVAVLDVAHCNAVSLTGCAQTPASVEVGVGAQVVRVSPATDTVYVSNTGPSFSGNTVSVIDGSHCNGRVAGGCAAPAATVTTGAGPVGIAVDDARHVVYIANNADGDAPGSVTVLDTLTCSGTHPAGCAGSHPAIPSGRAAQLATINPADGTVYIADFGNAALSVIRGHHNNADRNDHGRNRSAHSRLQPVGSGPFAVAVNPHTHTVYTSIPFADGGLSISST
jgi:DNA-binding beta-propeller fold protein YncE